MADQKRGVISEPHITHFKGIDRYKNIAAVAADHAIDLLNVACAPSGGCHKIRQPKPIIDPAVWVFTGTCYGLFDFQQPNGTKQIVTIFDKTIYYIASDINGNWTLPVVIDTNANNASFWSAVSSNNILFMANGKRMLKWTGTDLWKWGIESLFGPGEPVPVIVSVVGGGNITLGTGRKYRAALYNSVTDTLGTASDASASSGPCDSSKITVQIDVTAQAAADPQADKVRWYATLDNGVLYYFHSDVAINHGGPTQLVDNLPDPETGGEIFQPTATLLANPANQQPQTGGVWEYIVYGNPQWRTVGSPANPSVGDLPWMYSHNFGFNVPANATIVGVAVNFQAASQSATTSFIDKVGIYYQGKQIGTLKSPGVTPIPMPVTNYAYGDASDDWGANLTPAKVNDPSFGFGVELNYTSNAAGQRLFLFEFGMTVYYQIPQDNSVTLNLLQQAQLINDPPPVGKYLASWGERIYIAGLVGFPQDIVYSGYEQILDGRPEEAYPPGNRLRLAVGADWIRGMGKVQAGLVIGSKSNEMFMFRGDVEDVVTGTPLSFTEVLETLPFSIAFASHYSIMSTPEGLVFLSAQRTIDGYTGAGRPSSMSAGITSLLKSISTGSLEACQAVFYNYLDKDWYVLGIPTGNNLSVVTTKLMVPLGDVDGNIAIVDDASAAVYWNEVTGLLINGHGTYINGARGALVKDTNNRVWVFVEDFVGTGTIHVCSIIITVTAGGPQFVVANAFDIAQTKLCRGSARVCTDGSMIFVAQAKVYRLNQSTGAVTLLYTAPTLGAFGDGDQARVSNISGNRILISTGVDIYEVDGITGAQYNHWTNASFGLIAGPFNDLVFRHDLRAAWVTFIDGHIYRLDLTGLGKVDLGVFNASCRLAMSVAAGKVGVILWATTDIWSIDIGTNAVTHGVLPSTSQGQIYADDDGFFWTADNFATDIATPSWKVDAVTLAVVQTYGYRHFATVPANDIPRSQHWQRVDVQTNVGAKPDTIIVIDLDEDSDGNDGIYLFNVGPFDVISLVENPVSGRPMILLAQNGIINELQPIIDGNNDIPVDNTIDDTVNLPAWWRSGYFGAGSGMIMHYESPQAFKMFRYANVIASMPGGTVPTVNAFLVDDRNYTFTVPKAIGPLNLVEGGKATINWKARRCSVQVLFPTADQEAILNELWVSRISTSER